MEVGILSIFCENIIFLGSRNVVFSWNLEVRLSFNLNIQKLTFDLGIVMEPRSDLSKLFLSIDQTKNHITLVDKTHIFEALRCHN